LRPRVADRLGAADPGGPARSREHVLERAGPDAGDRRDADLLIGDANGGGSTQLSSARKQRHTVRVEPPVAASVLPNAVTE
jgi:hypothetical protein